MKKRVGALIGFLRFMYFAKRWDAFHSPFLFRLFANAGNENKKLPFFDVLENKRRRLLSSTERISRMDLGAGSATSKPDLIAAIAASSLSHPFQCRFMARLVMAMEPRTIVELGTSLGVSAAYMASASPASHIITVEGDPAIAHKAQQLFTELSLQHITLLNQSFEAFISNTAELPRTIDLLFIDGHHRGEYLLGYFTRLSEHFHSGTVVIVDDIHWSADMYEAWQSLIKTSGVTQSVDCFHFGLLFFSDDFINPEHHRIRFPVMSYFR